MSSHSQDPHVVVSGSVTDVTVLRQFERDTFPLGRIAPRSLRPPVPFNLPWGKLTNRFVNLLRSKFACPDWRHSSTGRNNSTMIRGRVVTGDTSREATPPERHDRTARIDSEGRNKRISRHTETGSIAPRGPC